MKIRKQRDNRGIVCVLILSVYTNDFKYLEKVEKSLSRSRNNFAKLQISFKRERTDVIQPPISIPCVHINAQHTQLMP